MTGVLQAYAISSTPLRNNSTDSFYHYDSDFGEGCLPELDGQLCPVLTPVYNGRALDISPQLVHASLSGISIKHYYGKCSEESSEKDEIAEDENFQLEQEGEIEEFDWAEGRLEKPLSELSKSLASFYAEGQPLCTLPKMNFRNSFWNIHRPELCKLTWGQKYVSTVTVTDHLHGHLMQHGPLCEGFHTEGERQLLLDKELDEYVRLKVLASPRGIPPEEPYFSPVPRRSTRSKKDVAKMRDESLTVDFIPLVDDDEITGKNIRRLKEEFCLTIGKHKREPPIMKSLVSLVPESSPTLQPPQTAEEEGDSFYYEWNLNATEETFDGHLDVGTPTQSISFSETDSLAGPCPPLILDEFCKAAGKVDFSDMRCPDL